MMTMMIRAVRRRTSQRMIRRWLSRCVHDLNCCKVIYFPHDLANTMFKQPPDCFEISWFKSDHNHWQLPSVSQHAACGMFHVRSGFSHKIAKHVCPAVLKLSAPTRAASILLLPMILRIYGNLRIWYSSERLFYKMYSGAFTVSHYTPLCKPRSAVPRWWLLRLVNQ